VRILVVEDERKVAEAIEHGLTAERHTVTVAMTGEKALALLAGQSMDLVVLDLGLPGRDGIEVLDTMRRDQIETPVLILSARDSPQARVMGLDSGADDYLVKPFEFAELVARIRAIARRSGGQEPRGFKIADLEMDVLDRTVTRGAAEIELTNREFEILRCLFRNLRQPVSRRFLADHVWKGMARATPLDNVIDVHMARLRRKIDADQRAALIHTIRGVGFVLTDGEP